jgi:hypothetical protein
MLLSKMQANRVCVAAWALAQLGTDADMMLRPLEG